MRKDPGRFGRRTAAAVGLALAAVVGAGLGPASAAGGTPTPLTPTTPQTRVDVSTPSYDYAPALLEDGGRYRMWWCSATQGDTIRTSTAPTPTGPWSAPAVALAPSRAGRTFDYYHVCDPSVVRLRGQYVMYYGGLNVKTAPGLSTRIGVATSPDGTTFTRANGGAPVITPRFDVDRHTVSSSCAYGAGQPSAVVHDGWVYVAYTDTTARGLDACTSGGVYLARSRDPLLASGVEVLTAKGFVPRTPDVTPRRLSGGASVELTYSDVLGAFVMVRHVGQTSTVVTVLDPKTFATQRVASIPGTDLHDGPGVLKQANGRLPAGTGDLTSVPLVIAHGYGGPSPYTWDLATDVTALPSGLTEQDLLASGRLPALLAGYRVNSPGRADSLVTVDGSRVRFASGAPMDRLTGDRRAVSGAVLDSLPVVATVLPRQDAVAATGRAGGFLAHSPGGRVFLPVSCPDVLTANGSSLRTVDVPAYDALPKGPELFCRGDGR